ncbi:zinc ABC transporter ATP-binding protein AztA [Rhodococcus sp. NPDC058521]|uniref:zinc ABC transporter ATP-binding protein AztA n=1 Tax=Rhodococcus sp. NPDC058521 TaxID=3346536 RepID=UPI00364CC9A8
MIVASELTVRYGVNTALCGVNARFEPGTVSALVGHNGSGKSTLLQVLAGVVDLASGSIEGVPKSVAYVPQRSVVGSRLPLSVREVVAMGAWERAGLFRRVSRSDRRCIDSAIDRLGLAAIRHRRLSTLSGGQCQRALLAQALVQRGDLLLLDEPSTGLDAEAATVIDEVIAEESARGSTVVVATHDMAGAARADQVIELERGSVREWPANSETGWYQRTIAAGSAGVGAFRPGADERYRN